MPWREWRKRPPADCVVSGGVGVNNISFHVLTTLTRAMTRACHCMIRVVNLISPAIAPVKHPRYPSATGRSETGYDVVNRAQFISSSISQQLFSRTPVLLSLGCVFLPDVLKKDSAWLSLSHLVSNLLSNCASFTFWVNSPVSRGSG